VWLPILDISGELELLRLEEGQADLDGELAALHPEVAGEPESTGATGPTGAPISLFEPAPRAPAPLPAPAPEPVVETAAEPVTAQPAPEPAPAPRSAPPSTPRSNLRRPDIVAHRKAMRLRHRLLVAGLVVAVVAVLAAAAPLVFGGREPQRDVTLFVDGQQTTVSTRAATVAEVLASHGVVLHAGDRVTPSASASVSEDMPIRVHRAFPVTVDVDGTTRHARTARRDPAALQRDLHLASGLVLVDAPERLQRDSLVTFRTPHDVSVIADGATTPVAHSTALTVGELLASRQIALGPNDEVRPALDARLADGAVVTVYRLAENQVAREEPIAYPTENRDDPNLARGQERVLQEGRNGVARVVVQVLRRDGITYDENRVSSEVLTAPTPRVVARGTKTPAPPPSRSSTHGGVAASTGGAVIQSGSASWYGTGPGPGTCAHLSLPMGTRVRVVNTATGASAVCRVADRGPQAWTGHIIDLSPDVFAALAPRSQGIIRNVQLLPA